MLHFLKNKIYTDLLQDLFIYVLKIKPSNDWNDRKYMNLHRYMYERKKKEKTPTTTKNPKKKTPLLSVKISTN